MTLDVRQLPADMRFPNEPDDGREEWRPDRNGLHQVMLYLFPLLGFGQITEETVNSFYFRVAFYERLHGAFLVRPVVDDDAPEDEDGARPLRTVPRPIRLEDVRRFIGLQMNVFPDAPPVAQFERNAEYFADVEDRLEDGRITNARRHYESDEFEPDEYGEQLLPVTPVSGSDAEFALRIFNRFVAEGEYQLNRRLKAGQLSCGCSAQITDDERHEEDCGFRSPARY